MKFYEYAGPGATPWGYDPSLDYALRGIHLHKEGIKMRRQVDTALASVPQANTLESVDYGLACSDLAWGFSGTVAQFRAKLRRGIASSQQLMQSNRRNAAVAAEEYEKETKNKIVAYANSLATS